MRDQDVGLSFFCTINQKLYTYWSCLLFFQISSLIENVQRLQSSLNQMRESSATKIRLLEDQLEQKQDLISRLEARLDSQRDYDELKRELMLMKGSPLNDPSINGVDSKDTKDNNKRPSKISPSQKSSHSFRYSPISYESSLILLVVS